MENTAPDNAGIAVSAVTFDRIVFTGSGWASADRIVDKQQPVECITRASDGDSFVTVNNGVSH